VDATGKKFVEQEQRICELEANLAALQTKSTMLEKSLHMREEEIANLRGECKNISMKMIDVEEQNQGLREENALAFTKVYKKLESSSTPEGNCWNSTFLYQADDTITPQVYKQKYSP
jgi:predicted ribosome quality control (RQC) complex YloA/Tae2 family protein